MKHLNTCATALLALLCACRTTPGPAGPLAVPASETSYYLFRENGIELYHGEDPESEVAYPVEAGLPTAVGVDPNGGWAAAVYERGLIAIQLLEGRMLPVEGVQWTSPPTAIGVRGALAGTVEDGTIGLYRVTDGRVLWRPPARELLAGLDVSELRFVLPRTRDELVVVGHRGMGPFSRPNTVVLAVDRSAGEPVVPRYQPIPALHVLSACASDGENLYLAGEHDEERLLPGTVPGRQLVPSLLLVHVDPATLESREILREEREDDVRIRHMAVGYGLLALCYAGGELEVYRLRDGRAVRAFSNRYATEVSAACLGPDQVVISAPASSRIQTIP